MRRPVKRRAARPTTLPWRERRMRYLPDHQSPIPDYCAHAERIYLMAMAVSCERVSTSGEL